MSFLIPSKTIPHYHPSGGGGSINEVINQLPIRASIPSWVPPPREIASEKEAMKSA